MGEMDINIPARLHDATAVPCSSELAEGLMLVRASTLKMIRLQLAMQRSDRLLALEAVDDLVALDGRLQDYLEGVPSTGNQLKFWRELDADRAALNQEKLTLVAGIVRRPGTPVEDSAPIETGVDALAPPDPQFEPDEPRRKRRWLAILPVLALGLAAAGYLGTVPEVTGWIVHAAGTIR